MQITLNHEEILVAIEGYVRERISIQENQTIVIDMKAGRGENGYSATLDIVSAGAIAPMATFLKTITATADSSLVTLRDRVNGLTEPEIAERRGTPVKGVFSTKADEAGVLEPMEEKPTPGEIEAAAEPDYAVAPEPERAVAPKSIFSKAQ